MGDPAPLTVYQAFYQAYNLLENRPASVRLGGGGLFHPHESTATLTRARFAGVDFFQVPGVFPSGSVWGSSSTLVSGNIGMGILCRFRLIIDCTHNRLYAQPNAGIAVMPFVKDSQACF